MKKNKLLNVPNELLEKTCELIQVNNLKSKSHGKI